MFHNNQLKSTQLNQLSSQYTVWIFAILLMLGITISTPAQAGNLTPPGAPANTMYTLTDLYNLATGATTTEGTGSIPSTPEGAAVSTFHTLTEIYEALLAEVNKLSSTTLADGTVAFGVTGSLVSTPAGSPGQTIVTGQTICYNAAGASIACAGTGQDGEVQAGLTFDYTDNGNGTVTDNNTGLTWEQGYSTTTRTWQEALDYCNNNVPNLPGTGWRLPNVKELFTLVDFTVSANAKIDLTVFPGTPAAYFWSATTYPFSGHQYGAVVVNFYDGGAYGYNKSTAYRVRCVQE